MKVNQITKNSYSSMCFGNKEKTETQNNYKAFIGGTVTLAVTTASILTYRNHATDYRVQLAKELSKELGKNITAKDLKAVITRKELLKELSKLTEENYILTENNLKNGTFLADLHSHSNYSDGVIGVQNLLDEVAEYGNKLNQLKGKKFLFALSDHDGVEGVKEALKIIAQNPQKYENIRFVPATEISFVFPCQKESPRFRQYGSDVQMPELLIYNINPFSETTNKFFENIYARRESQIDKAIKDACSYYNSNDFTKDEYKKFYMGNRKPFMLNQHWKLWNYINTKSRIVAMAKEQNKDAKVLYEEIFKKTRKGQLTPYSLDEFIRENKILTKSKMFDEGLKGRLISSIFPKQIDKKNVHSDFEIQLGDIVEYSKKENALLGFAHPAFLMQNFPQNELLQEMRSLVNNCQGQIRFAEKYHQAYPIGKEVTQKELDEYNRVLDALGLINVGGRDNHKGTFFPKDFTNYK